jgi:copper oxidase (laccase) domain-containing protein
MPSDFAFVVHNNLELLVYLPWWTQGVLHGMTTRQFSFSGEAFNGDVEVLQNATGASYVAILKQCHGADVVDLRSEKVRQSLLQRDGDLLRRQAGDAIVTPVKCNLDSARGLFGVLTADCVPIIVRGDQGYVIIHAGWRGLASGVISAALKYVGAPQEAVIFAAAGPRLYQVGVDVIEALGSFGVYIQSEHNLGKYLLDTAATAAKQLSFLCAEMTVCGVGLCTIEDGRFHSYRRDGVRSGRCLTFITAPKE